MKSLKCLSLAMALLAGLLSSDSLASECATCQGSWKVGGGVYYILRTGERFDAGSNYSNWGMSFTPNFEKFIADGLSIGPELMLSYNRAGSKYYYSKQVDYGIIPTVSGYFPLGAGQADASSFFFVKVGVGFAATYLKRSGYDYWYYGPSTWSDTDISTIVAAHIGLMPMLSRSIGLEIGTHAIYSSTEGSYGVILQFGAGFSMFAI